MPYTREQAYHTAFVRRIMNEAKVRYLEDIEKDLTDFYNRKRQDGGLGKPAIINEPPTDVNDKYILYQDLNTLEYLRSIDFEAGVCNMIISTPHMRNLANPVRVQNVINTRFQQVDQIVTKEDMEDIIEQKGDWEFTDEDKGTTG